MGAEGRGNPLPSRFILSSPRFASASLALALALFPYRSFFFFHQPLLSDTRLHLPDSPKISQQAH